MSIMDGVTYLEHSGPLVYRNKHPNPMRRAELFWTPGYKRSGYFGVSGAHDGEDLKYLHDSAVEELAEYRRGVYIGVRADAEDWADDKIDSIAALRCEMIDTAVMQALADISALQPSYVTPAQMCRYWLDIGVGQTAHYLISCRWRTLFNTDEDQPHAR